MPWTSKHLHWLVDTKSSLKTACGKTVLVFEFKPDLSDKTTLSAWAKHFRNHYCLDSEIDTLRSGTGLSRAEYLKQIRFPGLAGFGPGIRSGDFGEIMVADFLEFSLKHWVPRTRYSNKTIRDESTKGTDLIGFKLFNNKGSSKDVLTMFEVKAQLSGPKSGPRLQDAIDDSAKDLLRKAESLNAIKQRLLEKGMIVDAEIVERYQNMTDKPYTQQFGAAAIMESSIYSNPLITDASTSNHPDSKHMILIVISSLGFMTLVHNLYNQAADEA